MSKEEATAISLPVDLPCDVASAAAVGGTGEGTLHIDSAYR